MLVNHRRDSLSMNMCCVATCAVQDLLHTRCPRTVSHMGPNSVGFIASNLHHVLSLLNRRAAPELQRGWR